jgi:DNA-binding HxlR family transcriptional regulator
MSMEPLHKTQVSILHSLRYSPSARFNELMRPTAHTSDTFKFHLRKLMKLDYVHKTTAGDYQLTPKGKEFANNLDEQQRAEQKQPKLSVLIVASRQTVTDQTQYLLQKRARQPFLGYWNEITGPVRWGWTFEEAAQKVFTRQTGMQADFAVHGMRRIRDYSAELGTLLEDKLFVIAEATNITGELSNDYAGGTNAWLTLDELQREPKYFASTPQIIESCRRGDLYTAQDLHYRAEEY